MYKLSLCLYKLSLSLQNSPMPEDKLVFADEQLHAGWIRMLSLWCGLVNVLPFFNKTELKIIGLYNIVSGKDFRMRVFPYICFVLLIYIKTIKESMKNHLKHFFLLAVLAWLCTATAVAQVTLKGKVVDAENNEPLIGATVSVKGKSRGVITDMDGAFTLKVNSPKVTLVFTYVGYNEETRVVKSSENVDLGEIPLTSDAVGLGEVSVIASIIKKDRQTPIPISNVKLAQIEEKMSNLEFPELLKSTPSVYVTRDSGGYGDSRINMRGFDSSNLGIMINGVPINGMENGKVYWSNWSALSDAVQFMQVQRGLGASALGLSSVGGTMNMVTKGADAKRGGSAYIGIGNDGFRKYNVTLSTGQMENGWALTMMGALNTGDGYIKGTNYEGWTYFGSLSKEINRHHKLVLTAFGAPQWHNQRGTKHYIEDYKNSPDGGRYNNGYGYINGKVVGAGYGYNYYHKPQVSLNHYWTIDEKSSLSTSLYGSWSKGGGRRVRGSHTEWLTIDNKTGRPKDGALMTNDNLFDYDAVYAANASADNGSQVIFTNAVNDHNWYGLLSSYKNHFTDKFTLTAGFDGRYYKGFHHEVIDNLLGGQYYMTTSPLRYQTKNQLLKKGDVVQYDSAGEIVWAGAFAQAEYTADSWSAFVSGSLTNESYRYIDRGGKLIDGKDKSKFVNFLPFSVKGGFNYKFTQNHNAFFNAGYFTRAPYFNTVFPNNTIEINNGAPYEKIITFELGYGFSTENINVALNGYYTRWNDKSLKRTIAQETANITGLDAVHYGVELEATYKPVSTLELKGMFSWGDWKWSDDVNFTMYNENNEPIGTYNAYVKDLHVGNSAQMTAAFSLGWEVFKGVKIYADYNYAGKNYADFDPSNRTEKKDSGIDAWKLPDFYTIDLGMNYKFNISKNVKGTLYVNVNNLTNVEYISDATDGANHDRNSALVYYGFGRTWSTGFKVIF